MHAGYKCFVHKTSTLQKISLFVTVKVHRKSTKKPSQIRITDGRNPLVSVDKGLINNTIADKAATNTYFRQQNTIVSI